MHSFSLFLRFNLLNKNIRIITAMNKVKINKRELLIVKESVNKETIKLLLACMKIESFKEPV